MKRLDFLDYWRGWAIVLMVFNHTARWWLESATLGALQERVVYFTVTLAAPFFLFLVGFSLALSFFRAREAKRLPSAKIVVKYLKRGLFIIILGYVFNFLILTSQNSILRGQVLQAIGSTIILAIPFLFLSQKKFFQFVFLALALAIVFFGPIAFSLSVSAPLLEKINWFFTAFPLIPWFGFALLGLVLGRIFLELRDNQKKLAWFFGVLGFLGVIGLAIAFVGKELFLDGYFFAFGHDFVVNAWWAPKGLTVFWVLGMIFIFLVGCYFLDQFGKWRITWLKNLGQTALMIYFAHHLIGLDLLSYVFNFKLATPVGYFCASLVFLVILVFSSGCWLELINYLKKKFDYRRS
ncbi:MAG: heparan-alpha-glucosaminide N-acetyltransferase domain-containing protein [Patescibacteria group bacterium]